MYCWGIGFELARTLCHNSARLFSALTWPAETPICYWHHESKTQALLKASARAARFLLLEQAAYSVRVPWRG